MKLQEVGKNCRMEFHNLYSSPRIIRVNSTRRVKWEGQGKKKNACSTLMGKPERKRPPGRPKYRCMDNIKLDLEEIGWHGMDWIDLVQDKAQ
jgi:hypothetical protein